MREFIPLSTSRAFPRVLPLTASSSAGRGLGINQKPLSENYTWSSWHLFSTISMLILLEKQYFKSLLLIDSMSQGPVLAHAPWSTLGFPACLPWVGAPQDEGHSGRVVRVLRVLAAEFRGATQTRKCQVDRLEASHRPFTQYSQSKSFLPFLKIFFLIIQLIYAH